MSTFDNPLVIALAKALGSTPQDIRQNFELLVQGGLRSYTDSPTMRFACGFTAALDADARKDHPGAAPDELFDLYRGAVRACPAWSDVLGAVHAHVLARAHGEGLGQFFTPEDLADLAAALHVDHRKRHYPKLLDGRTIRMHEPAVGAGGLILAQFRGGVDPACCLVDAWDLDPLCCAMTALQFCANVVEHTQQLGLLIVRQGNPLTRKHKTFWFGFGDHDMAGEWAAMEVAHV